jgi:uncharacterized protein (TIGR02118 family)
MYKVIGMLKRPEGTTFEQFRTWWLREHVPRVKKWPGLQAYHINMALNEDEPFDGVAEVWFRSKQEAEGIFSTEEGHAAKEAAMEGSSSSVIFVVEEHTIVKG